jgi:hypothetical protein
MKTLPPWIGLMLKIIPNLIHRFIHFIQLLIHSIRLLLQFKAMNYPLHFVAINYHLLHPLPLTIILHHLPSVINHHHLRLTLLFIRNLTNLFISFRIHLLQIVPLLHHSLHFPLNFHPISFLPLPYHVYFTIIFIPIVFSLIF